jgi:glycine oxidase
LNLLPPGAIRDAEPAIMIQGVLALHSPAERHVNPVALACALQAACERLGVAFRHAEVHSLRPKGGRIAAIITSHGEIACGQVVAASGVWTAALLAPLGLEIPISPVKGQLFHLHPEPLPLNHTIYSHGLYLVPRRVPPGCGELVVGASEEPKAGFDTATTESAIAGLRSGAEVLIPSLSSAPLVAAKAGLRPVTPDRVPLIGRHPNYGNLAIAAGHGRNGILMAPITADFVADLLLNDVPPPALVAPDRFSRKTA